MAADGPFLLYRFSCKGVDMIKIRIGEAEKDLASADEHWINQQINRRREEGLTVCVKVTIHEGGLDMVLSTSSCGGAGGGKLPSPKETEVFSLWKQRGLDKTDFTGGNLVAFLKQLKRFL
jgi:hypothetical protein